jgi:hypothetical protein
MLNLTRVKRNYTKVLVEICLPLPVKLQKTLDLEGALALYQKHH